MSKPVTYSVLIRDGQKKCYEDIWVCLFRELLFGPEAFAEWLSHGEETDWEPEELSGVAFVNFDTQELRWGEREVFRSPRVHAAYHRLLEQAWPGFSIQFLTEGEMYAEAQGRDDDDEAWDDRPEEILDVAGIYDDDGEEDDEEEYDRYDDDIARAWLTIVDSEGRVRQRNLEQLSADLISGRESAMDDLARLKAAEVPPEKAVTEGLWINVVDRQIGVWGGPKTKRDFRRMQNAWQGWTVTWSESGYRDQCAMAGHEGMAMSDAEALAEFVPHVLSANKSDMTRVFGAMGGELRKTAVKATGCLLSALAVPILLIGYFMEKLKEAGYVIVALVVIAAIAFKVIESKVKSRFTSGPFEADSEEADSKPPVAGPLEQSERRQHIDRLLSGCGFPPLSELEPHFPKALSLSDFM